MKPLTLTNSTCNAVDNHGALSIGSCTSYSNHATGVGAIDNFEPSTSPTQLFPTTLRGGGAIENHGGAIVNYVSVTLDEKMYSKEIRA
jgi:hypothetical protein